MNNSHLSLTTLLCLCFMFSPRGLLASEGLFYLNSFLETAQYFSVSAQYDRIETEVPGTYFKHLNNEDHELTVNLNYGIKLKEKWYIEIDLPISYGQGTSLDYVHLTNKNHYTSGVREPGVTVHHRLQHYQHEDSGERFLDLWIYYIPSLFDRQVGTQSGNRFHGKNSLALGASRGARYERFEAKIGAQIEFNSSGNERNLKLKRKYTFSSYTQTRFDVNLQYNELEKWPIFLGIGMNLTSNYNAQDSHAKSQIQRGTATFAQFGTHYLQSADLFWTTFISYYHRGTFITNTHDGNFQGRFAQYSLNLGLTKQF